MISKTALVALACACGITLAALAVAAQSYPAAFEEYRLLQVLQGPLATLLLLGFFGSLYGCHLIDKKRQGAQADEAVIT
jgi:hypothetical protein